MSSTEQDYCCKTMDYYTDSEYSKKHELIGYHSESRKYTFLLHGLDAGLEQRIIYCPCYDQKFPKDLGKQWCKIIKEKFGFDTVFAEEWAQLSGGYKTDA